jgi:Methyltransferase FkbM domain
MKQATTHSKRKPATTLALLTSFALGFLAAFSFLSPLDRGRSLQNTDSSPDRRYSESFNTAVASQKEDGWKTIDVFYGTRDHLSSVSNVKDDDFRNKKFFSQVKQDVIVSKLFREKRGGFFVDLAANDAVWLSNTYALETHFGWGGICIEPNAVYWPSLSYRRCSVVAAVAGGDREQVDFFFSSGGAGVYGGIVGDQYDNTEASNKRKGWREPRLTVQLEEVFQRFNAPKVIDYFSLDVEGAEGLVLKQSVLSRYRFKVISLERPKEPLKKLLAQNGYTMLKQLSKWGETLWAHESALQELDVSSDFAVQRSDS